MQRCPGTSLRIGCLCPRCMTIMYRPFEDPGPSPDELWVRERVDALSAARRRAFAARKYERGPPVGIGYADNHPPRLQDRAPPPPPPAVETDADRAETAFLEALLDSMRDAAKDGDGRA